MKAIEIGGALPSKAFETLPNIYLVGPMGAGKTTVGRHLAELLGREFLDSDHEIERKTGATIPWIFEKEGEVGFRTRETVVLNELTSRKALVLATGGGAITQAPNREFLSMNNIEDGIMRKATAGTELTAYEKARNKAISKIRYIVEQYFGLSQLHDGADRARFPEMIINAMDALFRQMAFNLFRGSKILKAA